jgi:hypothetical protein
MVMAFFGLGTTLSKESNARPDKTIIATTIESLGLLGTILSRRPSRLEAAAVSKNMRR